MAEVVLIRHGQASFGAANYDQLSELGQQQAVWLGEQFSQMGYQPDRIVMGSMVRHRQTAEGVVQGLEQPAISLEVQAGLNEYNFRGLLDPLQKQFPHQWQDTGQAKKDYYFNMRQALAYWMAGEIATDGEDSWASFCQRIVAAFDFACSAHAETGQRFKKILVVTSGGPIAVVLAHVLQLSHANTRQTTLQIKNTSCTKFLFNSQGFTLDSFNDISHLQRDDRAHAITFS